MKETVLGSLHLRWKNGCGRSGGPAERWSLCLYLLQRCGRYRAPWLAFVTRPPRFPASLLFFCSKRGKLENPSFSFQVRALEKMAARLENLVKSSSTLDTLTLPQLHLSKLRVIYPKNQIKALSDLAIIGFTEKDKCFIDVVVACSRSWSCCGRPCRGVEWHGAGEVSSSRGAPPDHHGARQFSLGELEQASNEFSENNLVGVGSFGLVYKGLLLDGTLVAIKRRRRAPRPEFVEEVHHLSAIRHRNLVTLIGYSQEGGLQMLVFEYLPNRSIRGTNQTTKLEFKQRLSVAIGAAKGLAHLHSLSPPLIHRNFKTSNVLVDENFIAKVADAGLVQLLERMDGAGSSQASVNDIFQDPQVEQMGVQPSESSDAYSFGVFLLELITGREVERLMVQAPKIWPCLVSAACHCLNTRSCLSALVVARHSFPTHVASRRHLLLPAPTSSGLLLPTCSADRHRRQLRPSTSLDLVIKRSGSLLLRFFWWLFSILCLGLEMPPL
ncbi:putative leucine-rich repeat receptor-like serine/threonine-protein kinase [Platanthera guangdongensis]|uniref:non-specific serine/threonine protein kinase n=1 Tax=Platanthera guangdongensis TaxID=2320717 RepID=A0ABR2M796_9ASPA